MSGFIQTISFMHGNDEETRSLKLSITIINVIIIKTRNGNCQQLSQYMHYWNTIEMR